MNQFTPSSEHDEMRGPRLHHSALDGRLPALCFAANRQLEYTKAGDGERLAMRVLHDDTGARVPLGALNRFSRAAPVNRL
jgi:hypothetical protein